MTAHEKVAQILTANTGTKGMAWRARHKWEWQDKATAVLEGMQLSWRGSSAWDCTICDKTKAEGSHLYCFSHCYFHPTLPMFVSSDSRQAAIISWAGWYSVMQRPNKIYGCQVVLCWDYLISLVCVFHHNVLQAMSHMWKLKICWSEFS